LAKIMGGRPRLTTREEDRRGKGRDGGHAGRAGEVAPPPLLTQKPHNAAPHPDCRPWTRTGGDQQKTQNPLQNIDFAARCWRLPRGEKKKITPPRALAAKGLDFPSDRSGPVTAILPSKGAEMVEALIEFMNQHLSGWNSTKDSPPMRPGAHFQGRSHPYYTICMAPASPPRIPGHDPGAESAFGPGGLNRRNERLQAPHQRAL